MAVKYYYFRSEPLNLTEAAARIPALAGAAVVAPTVTQPSFTVVTADDTYENDLLAAMSDQGFTLVSSTAVLPVFGQVRHHGALSAVPTTPAPSSGDRYFDTSILWELQYDGTSFKGLQWLVTSFAFNTASPLVLTPFKTTDYLMRAEVVVDTAFDNAAAQLQLGVAGDVGGVLDSTLQQISPTLVDTYRRFDRYTVGADTSLQLTITPAGSTQGAGRVFLEVWRSR